MGKYQEQILDKSIWFTATPIPAVLNLPFYIMEAGHFYAKADYKVKREMHNSYLLLYTLKGCGSLQVCDIKMQLPINSAILIDCHKFHSYASMQEIWEFLWMHINGSAVDMMFHMLYPLGYPTTIICSSHKVYYSGDPIIPLQPLIDMQEPEQFAIKMEKLINRTERKDIISGIEISASLHEILNILVKSSLNKEQNRQEKYSDYVEYALDIIHHKYSTSLSIENMIEKIPLSKYYFIRIFKRIMGVTPYSYLTNYRINQAKKLLRSTDFSVAEIAQRCGFLDTSNFIIQFKKHTSQKPLEYRKYFSPNYMTSEGTKTSQ